MAVETNAADAVAVMVRSKTIAFFFLDTWYLFADGSSLIAHTEEGMSLQQGSSFKAIRCCVPEEDVDLDRG